ncbi:ribonuclease H-like domain-containing protein [Mucidula mucida]|nr:ribonuclease H-like domain-containing protein [Mucidula mucida]
MPKNDLSHIRNLLHSSSRQAVARMESQTGKVDHYGLFGQYLEIRIAKSRERALSDAPLNSSRCIPAIYTDGSSLQGGVGAAAWSATLTASSTMEVAEHFHLGRSDQRTVLEAELVGVLLALGLVRAVRKLIGAIILSDSQSAIMAIRNGEVKGGERCLVEEFYRQLHLLVKSRPSMCLALQWIPAHEGASGNTRADMEAKRAAVAFSETRQM